MRTNKKIKLLLFFIFALGLAYVAPKSVFAIDYTCGLTKPVLTTPRVRNASGNVTVSWNAVSGANGYSVAVDNLTNRLSPSDGTTCSGQPGDACYGTKSTSFVVPGIQAGVPYHLWVAAIKPDATKPQGCVSPQADFWINTTYETIGGMVKDQFGQPMAGVGVSVVRNSDLSSKVVKTGSDGRYNVPNFIAPGQMYSVRVPLAPASLYSNAKTTTLGWTWNYCTNPNMIPGSPVDLYNQPFGDTVVGSKSYECQLAGSQIDCAGNENKSPYADQRCSFSVYRTTLVSPPPSRTPTFSPTPSPSPTPTPRTYNIVLILDKSSSIQSNIAKEKDAARQFVIGLSQTTEGVAGYIKVGLVAYNKAAVTLNGLSTIVPGSTSLNSLLANINSIAYNSSMNGSCINCAEGQANAMLVNSSATSRTVILVSDGRANASGITENPYPALNQPMKDAVFTAQRARSEGVGYLVAGYGSASRTRGDVLSAISGDSSGVGTGSTTDVKLLNTACSYPPSPFTNSTACRYIYEPNALNWKNQFADLAGKINPSFKTSINKTVAVAPENRGILAALRGFFARIFGNDSYDSVYADQ